MVTVYNFGYAENRTLEPKPDDLAALRPLPRQIINHFRKSFSEVSDIDSNFVTPYCAAQRVFKKFPFALHMQTS